MEETMILDIAGVKVKERIQDKLAGLGFTRAANKVSQVVTRKRKMAIAYEHYRFVRSIRIQQFNEELYARSSNDPEGYKYLRLTPVSDYQEVPPVDVLDKMQEAVGRKCFDSFEVAHIERVKDPILFGRIDGCTDYFYVAQWEDDVKIEDLLKENEG